MEYKQVIVIRRDLKLPPGKLGAQVAHASMGALFTSISSAEIKGGSSLCRLTLQIDKGIYAEWINGVFKKVCLGVDSLEELKKIYDTTPKDIMKSYIVDSGRTVFNGKSVPTCVGIGPAPSNEIDKITGHLKLY